MGGPAGRVSVTVLGPTAMVSPDKTLSVSLSEDLFSSIVQYEETLSPTSFPVTVEFDAVAPADYTVILCYPAVGTDDPRCSGPGDQSALYPGFPPDLMTVVEGETNSTALVRGV